MLYVAIFYMQWMYVFQLFYQAMYAGRNKRVMKFFNAENLIDTLLLLCGTSYLVIILRDYRHDTFLKAWSAEAEAKIYFDNYVESPVKENVLLFVVATLLWAKAVLQLRYLQISGNQFQMVLQFMPDLKGFMALFLVSMLLFALTGMLLFRSTPEFAGFYEAFLVLTSDPLMAIDFYLFPGTTFGQYAGYLYFWAYLCVNFFLVRNVIVAQVATTYKRVRQAGNTLYLLTTLSVREVSEADGKYSAVVSAPFPLTILNIPFGSVVLAARNPAVNLGALHLYYIPVLIAVTGVFVVYQLLILPVAYLKVAGHKWALVIKAPKGKGSSSSLDRAGQALLFQLFGPLLMLCSAITDTGWFIAHLYKTDLDKSITKKSKEEEVAELPEIHRRNYKKMIKYFGEQNDQLVL